MGNLKDIGYGIGKYLVASDASDIPDIGNNRKNLDLLNFKVATNNAYALYNFKDGMIDAYQTSGGVDAGASTNETYDSSGKYYVGEITNTPNYFGDSSDGALTTSGNVTHTVQNKNGSYDGDMVIKEYSTLTISAGHTMTTDQPCRGMFIYVAGNCTIAGTLSMTARGALANPNNAGGSDSNAVGANGIQLGMVTSGGSTSFTNDGTGFNGAGTGIRTAVANQDNLSSNGTVFSIAKAGGAPGAAVGVGPGGASNGNPGTAGTTGAITISTGGGAGGAANSNSSSGAGGSSTSFSGGSGGGGSYGGSNGSAGTDYGGAGGASSTNQGSRVGGGSGNPGHDSGSNNARGQDGIGGLIWLVVGGDLTITGSIVSSGMASIGGGTGAGNTYAGGGGSGAGAIMTLYGGTLSNSGSISGSGGGGGDGNAGAGPKTGGTGGAAGIHTAAVSAEEQVPGNLTLISNAQTANAAPDEGRLMIYEEASTGSTTLDTDLKGYVSRDGGTTYTQTPLALDSNITHPASLLLHCDGSNDGTTFTDSSFWTHIPTVAGNTHTDTAVKKFGTASAQFDGTGDYLDYATSPVFGFGTGDWTIDFWIYASASGFGSYAFAFDFRTDGNSAGSPYLFFDTGNSNVPGFTDGSGTTRCSSNVAMVNETWYHIAVVKYNDVTKVYTNGVTGASGTYATEFADTVDYKTTNPLRLAHTTSGSYALNGYLDEFRITKGLARWTANFTPDTSPYTGTEGDTRLVSGSVDISGQPSGTNMKYKIETLNQSASKVCRLHGASLLWA